MSVRRSAPVSKHRTQILPAESGMCDAENRARKRVPASRFSSQPLQPVCGMSSHAASVMSKARRARCVSAWPIAPERRAHLVMRAVLAPMTGSHLDFGTNFDMSLFERKLREPSRRMQEATLSRRRRVGFERRKTGKGKGIGFLVALVDSDLGILQEYLEDVDRLCREVWLIQANSS